MTAEAKGAISLEVDASDNRRGIVRVSSTIEFPTVRVPTLHLPKWLPAFHAPRGAIDQVAGLQAELPDGTPVGWERDPADIFAIRIDAPGEISSLRLYHQMLTPTSFKQGRITVGPFISHIQWAGLVFYPGHCAEDEIEVSAQVILPDGWQADGPLRPHWSGEHWQTEAAPLRRFVDSPLIAGKNFKRFELDDGVGLAIVADRADQLPDEGIAIDTHRRLIAEADALFGSRPFEQYDFLMALSDTISRMGLEHRHCSENGVRGDYFSAWDESVTERDLLPHEFVHCWIGKYRVPQGNLTCDFAEPMTNELMWVYEGLTQYYGHVLAARCGLISHDATKDAIALIAATYDLRPGRKWRHLGDTHHDPLINERSPQPWLSWQRNEDYYGEGFLVWLEADMMIRAGSEGRASLDDFARAFFGPECPIDPALGYDRGDVIAALAEVYSYDWESFIQRRIDRPGNSAIGQALSLGGYRLAWTDTPSQWSYCDQKHNDFVDLTFSLGLKIGREDDLIEVVWDSPAFQAGMTVGTEMLTVGGKPYSPQTIRSAIADAWESDAPLRMRVRQAGAERDVEIPWNKGEQHPVLERCPDLSDRIADALKSRA